MEKKTAVCRFHPELGEQPTFQIMEQSRIAGRPARVEDMLLCTGCLVGSKPAGRPEFAS